MREVRRCTCGHELWTHALGGDCPCIARQCECQGFHEAKEENGAGEVRASPAPQEVRALTGRGANPSSTAGAVLEPMKVRGSNLHGTHERPTERALMSSDVGWGTRTSSLDTRGPDVVAPAGSVKPPLDDVSGRCAVAGRKDVRCPPAYRLGSCVGCEHFTAHSAPESDFLRCVPLCPVCGAVLSASGYCDACHDVMALPQADGTWLLRYGEARPLPSAPDADPVLRDIGTRLVVYSRALRSEAEILRLSGRPDAARWLGEVVDEVVTFTTELRREVVQ